MNSAAGMKYRWLAMLGIVAGIGGMVWLSLPEAPASVDQPSLKSSFKLPDLQGVQHGLPTGEVVLLNFWATWCPPCRKEIPSMAELHDTYAQKGLKIIAVSVDQRRDDLASFTREFRMPFQVLHDADRSVSLAYNVSRYPESFLIDRDGKILYHLIGAVDWMSEPVIRTIEGMLAQPASETGGVGHGDSKAEG